MILEEVAYVSTHPLFPTSPVCLNPENIDLVFFDVFFEAVRNPRVSKSKSPFNRDWNGAILTECHVEFLR